jgi:hypothetical protein
LPGIVALRRRQLTVGRLSDRIEYFNLLALHLE